MRVLVLGAGGAASNGFARALRLAGGYDLIGTNCSETDLLLSECDENHVVCPVSIYDGWKHDLYALMQRHPEGGLVHAQSDREVRALAGFRSTVHALGWKTYLPSTPVIELCQDKWLSYEKWRDAGVPVPETCLAEGHDSLQDALSRHGEIWLRPRVGAGGQKSLRTKSLGLAVEWLNEHDGWGRFTCANALSTVTMTVQALYWKGNLVCSQQRNRKSWANAGSTTTGVSGSTGIGVTDSNPIVDKVADAAIAAIDKEPHGLYGVDMVSHTSMACLPRVTEINIGRFFTTAPEFFAMAGFNMALLYVSSNDDLGVPLLSWKDERRNPLPDGLRWIRAIDHMPVLDNTRVAALAA